MSKSKDKQSSTDHALIGSMVLMIFAMFQVNKTLSEHMKDCSDKSALVVKVLVGVGVIVLGQLLVGAFSHIHVVGN